MDGDHGDTLVPTKTRSCVVNKKCKVTKWSDWRLDTDCKEVSRRPRLVRSRTVERLPQGPDGKPCPHLTELKLYEEHKHAHMVGNLTEAQFNCQKR